MSKKQRQGFVLYHEDMRVCDLLTNEQLGVLVRLLWAHSEGREAHPDGDLMLAMYSFLAQKIDRDEDKYQRISEARREAAKSKNKASANDSK